MKFFLFVSHQNQQNVFLSLNIFLVRHLFAHNMTEKHEDRWGHWKEIKDFIEDLKKNESEKIGVYTYGVSQDEDWIEIGKALELNNSVKHLRIRGE